MKNFLPLLCSTSLFNGLTPEELQTLLAQLGAVMRSYGKGEALVLAGEPNRRVGIVLSGELEAYRPGPQGARIPHHPHGTGRRVRRCAERFQSGKPGHGDGFGALRGAADSLRAAAAFGWQSGAPADIAQSGAHHQR